MENMEKTKIAIQNDLEDIRTMKKDMTHANGVSRADCSKYDARLRALHDKLLKLKLIQERYGEDLANPNAVRPAKASA